MNEQQCFGRDQLIELFDYLLSCIEMGFEDVAGPAPSRKDELRMMKDLEDDWLAQPFYKYYMNEDLRKPKMAFAARLNQAKGELLGNFLIFGFMYLPVALLMRRLFIQRGGVPTTMIPNYFNKARTQDYVRQLNHFIWTVPTWFALTATTAALNTNFHGFIGDEFYKVGVKPERML